MQEYVTEQNIPFKLDHMGNMQLLRKRKLSIVGSRRPNQYAQEMTFTLADKLSKTGVCIVSGGAIGTDAIAHRGAGSENTICVLPCGIDERYPAIHRKLLDEIADRGLLLSQFEKKFMATKWSFVARNEVIVSLGELLIVTHAEPDGGSMRSVEFALKMGKKIYVLPHRIGESKGTNDLLRQGLAEPIWDIDEFVAGYGSVVANRNSSDLFIVYCSTNPTYEEVLSQFRERLFEAEFSGEIVVKNGRVYPA